MKKQKLTPSNILLGLVFAFIFLLMLFCNMKSPMLCDDYRYCFSFVDWSRIESVWQIFPSMVAHREEMNGRVVSHFLLQLFLMLPSILFKLVNSAFFVAMLAMVCKLAFLNKDRPAWLKPVTVCAAFATVWVYVPAFGTVFLWEAGSVNYLWATVIVLVYVYICFKSFCTGREPESIAAKAAFLVFSLIAGAYSETSAITTIGTVVLFSVLTCFFKKHKPSKLMIASFVLALAGFAFLLTAPGESVKIEKSLNAEYLLKNLNSILYVCKTFWPVIAVTDILFVVAVCAKADKNTLLAAAALVLVAMANMASALIAYYVPERIFVIPVVLLVVASAMLAVELFGKNTALSMVVHTLPILIAPLFVVLGVIDIMYADYQITLNEQTMISDAAAGKDTSYIDVIDAGSKYPALYNGIYISEDPETWPNDSMAKYYGIDQIIGVKQ